MFQLARVTSWVLASAVLGLGPGAEAGEIHDAVRAGDVARVTAALEADAAAISQQNPEGFLPLHLAALGGHAAIAELLLTHGARVGARDRFGGTALHAIAARRQFARAASSDAATGGPRPDPQEAEDAYRATARLLVRAGADVDARVDGRTPLDLATRSRDRLMVETLLALGADPVVRDPDGFTALHVAADRGDVVLVERLLAQGVPVSSLLDAPVTDSRTPLHLAAQAAFPDPVPGLPAPDYARVVEVLLAAGADRTATADGGVTPLDLALRYGRSETAAVLRRVGELGDPARLSIEGAHAFTAHAIRTALARRADLLVASHPMAPLDEYLTAIESSVLAGYQDNGFPDATARVTLAARPTRIRVEVGEGRRHVAGGVRIFGATTIPVDGLIYQLTHPSPAPDLIARIFTPTGGPAGEAPSASSPQIQLQVSDEKPTSASKVVDQTGREVAPREAIWKLGEPAPFAPVSVQRLAEQVGETLTQLGYFSPRVRVIVVPTVAGTADLEVEILAEGVRGVVGDIEISGNSRDTRDDLLQYLGVAPGTPMSQELIARAEQRLWQSGRYVSHEVTAVPDGERGRLTLKVALDEYELAPPLSAPLSAEATAMLKLRDWLADLAVRGDDLVVDWKNPTPGLDRLELVAGPRGTVLVIGDRGPSHVAVLSPGWISLVGGAGRHRLVAPVPPGELWTTLTLQLKRDGGQLWHLPGVSGGFHFRSGTDDVASFRLASSCRRSRSSISCTGRVPRSPWTTTC